MAAAEARQAQVDENFAEINERIRRDQRDNSPRSRKIAEMKQRIRRDEVNKSPTHQAEEQERAAREANEARWAQVDEKFAEMNGRIRRDEVENSPRCTNARWARAMTRDRVSAYAVAARFDWLGVRV